MDDIIILWKDKTELHGIKETIESFLNNELHLSLNNKTTIAPVKTGISFVGVTIWDNYRKLKKQTARRILRNTRRLCQLLNEGEITRDEVQRVFASYNGILSHCNSGGLKGKIYEIFEEYGINKIDDVVIQQ